MAKYAAKQFTFDEITAYMRGQILLTYDRRNDEFGFDFIIESIKEPYESICDSCNPTITFHIPRSSHYCIASFDKWLKEQGFEWCEVNNNWGWRIKL